MSGAGGHGRCPARSTESSGAAGRFGERSAGDRSDCGGGGHRHSCGLGEDVAAAEAAVEHALSREWIVFETSVWFDFEIYCDSATELSAYAEARRLRGAEIPYEEFEERRREAGVGGQAARLRCRRPWTLSTYRKK